MAHCDTCEDRGEVWVGEAGERYTEDCPDCTGCSAQEPDRCDRCGTAYGVSAYSFGDNHGGHLCDGCYEARDTDEVEPADTGEVPVPDAPDEFEPAQYVEFA